MNHNYFKIFFTIRLSPEEIDAKIFKVKDYKKIHNNLIKAANIEFKIPYLKGCLLHNY